MAQNPATLRDATTPADLVERLQEIAGDGVPIQSIRFFCGSSEADAILAMIDAGEHSPFLAQKLGGLMFGGVATVRIAPVPAAFHCASRHGGRLVVSSCNSCDSGSRPAGTAARPSGGGAPSE